MSGPGARARAAAIARRAARSEPGRRLLEAVREPAAPASPLRPAEEPVDEWIAPLYGDALAEIEKRCGAGPEALALFRDLDDDLWALLLGRNYASYPNIRALLPEVPDPSLQKEWNGISGLDLLRQSKAFYVHARDRFAEHSHLPLADATVLDFGCGWGRLLGCDPSEEILEVCERSGLPATLARSDYVPERLPFEEGLDLVYSFSVFTHISEVAHEACLGAIHAALNPGGLLVVTIRPPAYLRSRYVKSVLPTLGGDPLAAMAKPAYVFLPHMTEGHPQYEGGEMTYGETVISLPYVRERWAPRFELLDVHVSVEDMHQVTLTLRRGG